MMPVRVRREVSLGLREIAVGNPEAAEKIIRRLKTLDHLDSISEREFIRIKLISYVRLGRIPSALELAARLHADFGIDRDQMMQDLKLCRKHSASEVGRFEAELIHAIGARGDRKPAPAAAADEEALILVSSSAVRWRIFGIGSLAACLMVALLAYFWADQNQSALRDAEQVAKQSQAESEAAKASRVKERNARLAAEQEASRITAESEARIAAEEAARLAAEKAAAEAEKAAAEAEWIAKMEAERRAAIERETASKEDWHKAWFRTHKKSIPLLIGGNAPGDWGNHGSGFLVEENGWWLVTNRHVIECASMDVNILTRLSDGSPDYHYRFHVPTREFLVHADGVDIAVLQLNKWKSELEANGCVPLSISSNMGIEELAEIIWVGHPASGNTSSEKVREYVDIHKLTRGESSLTKKETIGFKGMCETCPWPPFQAWTIVTTGAMNGGNSGGPVIDSSGDVIGVVSGGRDLGGGGRNFAIHARHIRETIRNGKRFDYRTMVNP